MTDTKRFSRRTLLKGLAGTAAASGMVGSGLYPGRAGAQPVTDKPALLVVFLTGGYNSVFNSADSYAAAATFGVNDGNQLGLGNGLVVDSTFSVLSAFAKEHIATIGVRHGQVAHGPAQDMSWAFNGRSTALTLASALGGDAAIKCAVVGGRMPSGPRTPEGGVSMQQIRDMGSTIAALGGSTDPSTPDRAIGAKGLQAAEAMSQGGLQSSERMLVTLKEGYKAGIETLQKPVQMLDFVGLANAYGHPVGTTAINNFTAQMVAAELMILAGANVVIAAEPFSWDSHGDRTATNVRNMMRTRILPPLNTFLNRMLTATGRNVSVAILGDFARSLPGSDHAGALSATVIGKKVRVGTTGKMSANVQLPPGTPSTAGLWAYLAKVTGATTEPFGPNPHNLVLT